MVKSSNRIKKKVDTSDVEFFSCPTDCLPGEKRKGLKGTKRGQKGNESDDEGQKERIQFQKYFASVKEYGNSTLTGLAKKEHKSDKLTQLGVRPEKKQTMPFKMAIGINAGRAKKAARVRTEAKQSGTVLATSLLNRGSSDRNRRERDPRDGPDIGVSARNGVLRIDRGRFNAKGRALPMSNNELRRRRK